MNAPFALALVAGLGGSHDSLALELGPTEAREAFLPMGPPAHVLRAQDGHHVETGYEAPRSAVELALSDDTFWLSYRSRFRRGDGYGSIGVLATTDDDYLVNARIMRFGEPRDGVPLGLGVGLGVYSAFLDEPDAEIFGISLTGSADYALPWTYPTTVGAEVSFSPDITTFEDAEEYLDVLVRMEVDLSAYATAMIGFRFTEFELDGGGDAEIDDAVHVGIRLGL